MNRIRRIRKYAILQHDSSDCGAACLVSVVKYLGGSTSIDAIRRLSGTSRCGTTMLGLYQAAASFGLDATGYEASIEDIAEFKEILILHVSIDQTAEHFIISFGHEGGLFILWDPAKGLIYLSKKELAGIWVSKKCLSLVPNKNFRQEKEERKEKLAWLINAIRPEKELLLISLVTGIVISCLGLVLAVFTQKLIDKILPSGNIKLLVITSVLVVILLSSRSFITALRQYLLLLQGKYFNIRIVDDFYGSLLNLPRSIFDTRRTGDFVARMNDTMRIQKVIADVAGIYAIDILVLVFTLILISFYSVISAFMAVIFLPLIFFMVNRWKGRIKIAQQDLMAGYASSESNFIDSLDGINEIRSLNWQNFFFRKNNRIYSDFQLRIFSLGNIRLKLNLMAGLAGTLFLMIVLVYSSMEVMHSRMTEGELMAILSLGSTLIPSVLNLALLDLPLSEARVALGRMFEFTRIKPESQEFGSDNAELRIRKLELRDISFRFPGKGLQLERICLTLEKRRLVSLVGECGSGKSTLANVILRFYEAESGNIVINDALDSHNVGVKNWRSRIGIIPQEIHIFNGTILQNILSELSESEISEMASTVSAYGLDGFINSFPSGLLTQVGEEGINLSGGEKQLLAFIRVLIRKPDILVIDEGTSSMDTKSESRILGLLTRLKSDTGILLISHRMNLVRKLSDEIHILDNRRIVNRGSHDELLLNDNLYQRFWENFM